MKKILLFIMMFITMSLAGPGLAAEGDGAILYKVGDKAVSDTIKYTGDSWNKFDVVKGSVTFDAPGEQILTLEVAQGYIDIDKFEFMVTDCAPGTDMRGEHPVNIDFKKAEENMLRTIDVFDANGKYLGTGSGYTVDDALRYAKLKHGLYLIKEKGKWTLIAK